MTIPNFIKDNVLLYWRRRWAMFFMNLVAALFAAPLLYWGCLFMPMVLNAANDAPILLGLNVFYAVGCGICLVLAAIGLGGCFSAMRKIFEGTDKRMTKELFRGIAGSIKTSLPAGALAGFALSTAQIGLVGLHAMPGINGVLRSVLSALLALQLFAAVALALMMLAQPDELRGKPLQTIFAAGNQIAARPLKYTVLCALTLLPLALLFAWRVPLLTFMGFLFVGLLMCSPTVMVWQNQAARDRMPEGKRKKAGVIAALGGFLLVDLFAIIAPLLRQAEQPARAVISTMQQTMDFIIRQAVLDADNGTLREMLAGSGVWPLLAAALLGSICCILTAYVCACYDFRLRGLLFGAVVVLQVFPMLSSYAGLELLLRNLNLGAPWVLGLLWILLYLFLVCMLYWQFRRLVPKMEKIKEDYPGVRLFFYYALPRTRYWIAALIALVTLGCWNDALAPFWHMRKLGAFSVSSYIWETAAVWERMLYPVIFLALLAVWVLVCRVCSREKKPKT